MRQALAVAGDGDVLDDAGVLDDADAEPPEAVLVDAL